MTVCRKCGYEWTKRVAHPRKCPACLRRDWDKPPTGKGRVVRVIKAADLKRL